ncbi:MAG: hypothetical protein AAGF58_02715 [Pseudomonadota bacterium]
MHYRHGPHHHDHPHDHEHDHGGLGHNHTGPRPVQWQTPHLPHGAEPEELDPREPDIDLVEQSFIEGFANASDATSFLRLAGIPLTGTSGHGKQLNLLRVEMDQTTDVGSISPHIGGGSFRYDPLPATLVSKRQSLRFIYHDGGEAIPLSFSEAKAITP